MAELVLDNDPIERAACQAGSFAVCRGKTGKYVDQELVGEIFHDILFGVYGCTVVRADARDLPR
jgi:hypothetical protein